MKVVLGISIENIARTAHQANKAFCEAMGDYSQKDWEDAPEWQRGSAINGVKFHIDNPGAKDSHSHTEWMQEKHATGWKYGPVKDEEKKEHPCMVPFEELPKHQQAKDALFGAVVSVLRELL